jgi:hypothetical protein
MAKPVILKAASNDRVLVSDIVDRFNKRPFGWPDNEILLIIGRLAATNQLTFQLNGGTLANKDAFEPLSNSRKRREVTIIKKRQTDEMMLKQARNLTQELFSSMGPSAEKELFAFYSQNFSEWLENLKSYKSKTDLGGLPGTKVIASAILILDRLFMNDDSFDFFKQIVENKKDYLDLEEDYRDVHEFFSNQLTVWGQLNLALQNFDKNKQALERDDKTAAALKDLHDIYMAETPYGQLQKVPQLISTVAQYNDALVAEKRSHAIDRIELKIQQLQQEISQSGIATAELSNRLLRPLQLVKMDLEKENSIPKIYMLQFETANEHLDDGLHELNRAIEKEEAKRKAQAKKLEAEAEAEGGKDNDNDNEEAKADNVEPVPFVKSKPIKEVSVAQVFDSVLSGVYIETLEQAELFINELKQKLESAVEEGARVRIR